MQPAPACDNQGPYGWDEVQGGSSGFNPQVDHIFQNNGLFWSAAKFPQEIKAIDNIGRQLDNKKREMASEIEIPIDTTAGQF